MSKKFKYTISAALMWAVGIVLTRYLLNGNENAFNLALWTTLIAVPYWIFILSRNRAEFKKISAVDIKILLGMGLVSTIGVAIIEIFALKYSPALNYSLLIRTIILFTIISAAIFLNEKITIKKIILALSILFGSYLLIANGQSLTFTRGDLFTLAEAALIAFGNNTLGKMATNRMSPQLSASASFLIGVIPIVLIAYFNNAIAIPSSFLLVALLGLSYILGTTLRFHAYKNATASYVTMIYSFTPVFVSLMAIPLLGESLSLVQILGGLFIILAGVAVEKLDI